MRDDLERFLAPANALPHRGRAGSPRSQRDRAARLSRVVFSSGKDDWQTPPVVLAPLIREFPFDLDVAATERTRRCEFYFGPDHELEACRDGLLADWNRGTFTGHAWCNPPYSRGLQGKFIAKAAVERSNGVTTVMLIPARTDTKAFHAHIWNVETHQPREGVEVRFLPGRIKFVGAKHGAPFPSMIVVFRGRQA